MSDYIRTLHEKRMHAWEQNKALLDTAASEGRELTAEEETSYRRANEDIDVLDQRLKEYLDAESRKADAERQFAEISKAAPAQESKDNGLRAFLRGETQSRAYDLRPDGPVDFRATLVTGTPTGAGDTIKTSFYNRLVQHLIVNSAVLQTSPTVLNTATGEALQIPKTTAHSSNASIVSEATALTENEPTFGQVTLNSYKYGFLMTVSHEMVNDTSVDLEGYLAMQAGRALGNGFGAHLVAGTGTNQPNGVLTAATLGKTGEAMGTDNTTNPPAIGGLITDDFIDLFYSVIAPYRNSPSCHWLMQDATVGKVRKLKDGIGQYIWQPGLTAGAPDTILGKPVVTDPNMPAVGSAAKSVLFGDFSTYYVRMVENIRFERSLDFHFDTDVITFRTLLRGDGDQVDTTGAIKYFQGGTA